jgi:hypothetical protein
MQKDKNKPEESFLSKVKPDRRRFVQTILGLAGYGTPVVRSFVMASAIGPAFGTSAVTTTLPPVTTTVNSWRNPPPPTTTTPAVTTTSGRASSLIVSTAPGLLNKPPGASGPLLKPRSGMGPKKP